MELTTASQTAFFLSAKEAEALKSTVVDSEHLWLGILKSEDLLELGEGDFLNLGAKDVKELKDEVTLLVARFKENRLECKIARRKLRKLLRESRREEGKFSGHRSPRCREAFSIAERISGEQESKVVSMSHLAQAVLTQGSLPIDEVLADLSVPKQALMGSLGGAKAGPPEKPAPPPGKPAVKESPVKDTPFLKQFGRDLVQIAREGKIDPVIGRSDEIRKLAQILSQKKKNNPVLVGDAGVGKTCVVEGLALKCADPNAPPMLKNLKIFEITMGSLIAGTMYRGQFEERLENLVKEASSDPRIVIFIDEIHTMIGAGGGVEGAMNAANILKPALARGLIKCIGATTTAEYRRFIEKDSALERRFQLVWVDEPTREDAVAILQGLKPKFEEHHGVAISDKAIEASVELSMRYLMDFRLPDKALDLIDQACAQAVLRTLSFSGGASAHAKKEIGREEIARVVSQRTRIPLDNLTAEEGERFMQMEAALRKRVKGQDEAVREVAEAVRTAKAGLKDQRRPVGVFLFLGSTGTGKTELAKALADFLFFDESKLIRFDMSEYQEKHSVSKLIGAPPGYVGHEDEGQLSSRVRTNPYSVILFDEIEKAHPEVFDIFLQIFDEGMLTDSKGRKVNFRESIIILTSNLGSAAVARSGRQIGIAFGKDKGSERPGGHAGASPGDRPTRAEEPAEKDADRWKEYRESIMKVVGQHLRPELLNRIQRRVIFYPLGRDTVREIIHKILAGINRRLAPKEISVSLTGGAVEFLMNEGYSEKDGARQMERVMEQHIVQPLGKAILEGGIKPGETIELHVPEGGGVLTFRTVGVP